MAEVLPSPAKVAEVLLATNMKFFFAVAAAHSAIFLLSGPANKVHENAAPIVEVALIQSPEPKAIQIPNEEPAAGPPETMEPLEMDGADHSAAPAPTEATASEVVAELQPTPTAPAELNKLPTETPPEKLAKVTQETPGPAVLPDQTDAIGPIDPNPPPPAAQLSAIEAEALAPKMASEENPEAPLAGEPSSDFAIKEPPLVVQSETRPGETVNNPIVDTEDVSKAQATIASLEEPKPKATAADKKISGKVSKAATAGAKSKKPAGTNASGKGSGPLGYIALVQKLIRANMFYPPAASSKGIKGKVSFTFTIGRTGRVTSFRVTRSSGNRVLDSAAAKIIRSTKFPPPPGGQLTARSTLAFGVP